MIDNDTIKQLINLRLQEVLLQHRTDHKCQPENATDGGTNTRHRTRDILKNRRKITSMALMHGFARHMFQSPTKALAPVSAPVRATSKGITHVSRVKDQAAGAHGTLATETSQP